MFVEALSPNTTMIMLVAFVASFCTADVKATRIDSARWQSVNRFAFITKNPCHPETVPASQVCVSTSTRLIRKIPSKLTNNVDDLRNF